VGIGTKEEGYGSSGRQVSQCPPITLLRRLHHWAPCGSFLGGAPSQLLPILVQQKPQLMLKCLELSILLGSYRCHRCLVSPLCGHHLSPNSRHLNCCLDHQIHFPCFLGPTHCFASDQARGSGGCLSCRWVCHASYHTVTHRFASYQARGSESCLSCHYICYASYQTETWPRKRKETSVGDWTATWPRKRRKKTLCCWGECFLLWGQDEICGVESYSLDSQSGGNKCTCE
jgi:hypothetical protein